MTTEQKIVKWAQIVAIIAAMVIFLALHSHVKYVLLGVLALALVAHFWEFVRTQFWNDLNKAKSEFGTIDQSVMKEIKKL